MHECTIIERSQKPISYSKIFTKIKTSLLASIYHTIYIVVIYSCLSWVQCPYIVYICKVFCLSPPCPLHPGYIHKAFFPLELQKFLCMLTTHAIFKRLFWTCYLEYLTVSTSLSKNLDGYSCLNKVLYYVYLKLDSYASWLCELNFNVK